MKILIVGSWVSAVYEEPLYQAFKELSYNAHSFEWAPFLNFETGSNKYDVKGGRVRSIWYRFQNKYIFGPAIFKINKELVKKIKNENYDIVFLYRATHIWEKTVKEIKKTKAKVFIYNNDDPFTSSLPKYVYRHYSKALKFADWIYAYREKNLIDYNKLGFKNCSILMSNFIIKNNFPISTIRKNYDVIFIGHYEKDGRDEVLFNLMKDSSLKIGLWGQNWTASQHYNYFCEYMGEKIRPLFGSQYNEMINKGKIALVFFSKINNDGYTRRCFEIPAAKTMMLCEHSTQMERMFTSDKEIVFFKSSEEVYQKVKDLLKFQQKTEEISKNGYQRLIQDKHEIKDRAQEIIKQYKLL